MDRQTRAAERLTQNLLAIGARPVVLSRDEWTRISEDGNSRLLLGFTSPIELGGVWCGSFCPEIIAATSEVLSDADFELYLDVIEFVMNKEAVVSAKGTLSAAQRIAAADDAVMAIAPDSLRLISEVELSALDKASQ